MRQWVRELSTGKNVLNAFSYTGGFSGCMRLPEGRSKRIQWISPMDAIEAAKRHVALNQFDINQQQFFCADVFKFLRDQDHRIMTWSYSIRRHLQKSRKRRDSGLPGL